MAGLNLMHKIMFKQKIEFVKLDEKSSQMTVTLEPRRNLISKIVFLCWAWGSFFIKQCGKLINRNK